MNDTHRHDHDRHDHDRHDHDGHDHDRHDHDRHDHDRHDHDRHDHDGHGHEHDQGWRGMARYLRMVRRMWSSPVSDAVVARVAPQPGELVLDLGAGMGAATVRAGATGAQVLAVDPTSGMRRVLRLRRFRGAVSVHAGAAESMPVADASVDALWCVNAVHHWTDREAALAEIARVMRPGGRVLLVDEAFDDPAHPAHEEFGRRHAAHSHHFDEVDPSDIGRRLAAAGFDDVQAGHETLAGRPAKVIAGIRRRE